MASKLIFRNFSGRINYYDVLGVLPSAKPNEIKLAYKKLVKELHPDVSGPKSSQEKFRLVAEAYSVLSKLETRATYDLTQGTKGEIEKILEKKRDKDGLDVAKIKYAPHQYGYKRLKELADERKAYNIDSFYRYKGGLPGKHQGPIRGSAYGAPGTKADANDLNFVLKGHNQISMESDYVDDNEAHEFKLYKTMEQVNVKTNRPYLRAEIDYQFIKMKTLKRHFLYYLGVFSIFAGVALYGEANKLALQVKIAWLMENVEHSQKKYEKAGMRAVGFRV